MKKPNYFKLFPYVFFTELFVTLWFVRPAWKHLCGSWYVFRDTPGWMVRSVRKARKHQDDGLRKIAQEADTEWRLRKRKQLQQLHALRDLHRNLLKEDQFSTPNRERIRKLRN